MRRRAVVRVLGFALASLGAVTVSGRIIMPLAGDLASPRERGRIVGIVSSGITTGILVSRFVAGIVAEYWDWRVIYVVAAVQSLAVWAPSLRMFRADEEARVREVAQAGSTV